MRSEPTLDLMPLFEPRTVAVIGASRNPEKLGWHVMTSLTKGGFRGRIVPVNPGSGEILGLRAAPDIEGIRGDVDLAVVVVPSARVPEVFDSCARKGVGGIVLITAGFKEIDDPEGSRRQEDLAGRIRRAAIPVIGPNTFGLVNVCRDLNATFTPEFSRLDKGRVALVSQSGGIAHLSAFLAQREALGISKVVGLGNRLNVDFADMLAFLMDDPDTAVIALYIEGMENPRAFLNAASAHRGRKPVVALKTGRSSAGDRASLSHTGSLAGRDELYQGLFRQAGILRVEETEALLDASRVLASSPLPAGNRVAVLTGQAGPGMAACDVCEAEGLLVPRFTAGTRAEVERLLPPLALRTNPVDMGPAWYDSEAITAMMRAVLEDEHIDAALLLMMFASANRSAIAGIAPFLEEWSQRKPVVACLTAPPGVWDSEIRELECSGSLVNFATPERAAGALACLWKAARLRERPGTERKALAVS